MELEEFKGNVLLRMPFKRIVPFNNYSADFSGSSGSVSSYPVVQDGQEVAMDIYERPFSELIPQSEFLREFYPSGHKINDTGYYPDKLTRVTIDGKEQWAFEKVSRCAFPFQYIITIKQLIHLCGNPISFRDSNISPSEAQKKMLMEFKQGWIDKNMEIAWYNCAKSEKITGDAACVFYYEVDGNKKRTLRWRTLSYLDGDTLYCHDDPVRGRIFARKYVMVNDQKEPTNCVEIWDDRRVYYFVQRGSKNKWFSKSPFKDIGLDGYELESSMEHGFSRCPVAYKRSMIGACWSMSQSNIDAYEMSVSQLMENNKAFAFPILFIRSEDAEIQGTANGRPFAIHATGEHDEASLLTKADASESFKLQLETQLRNIFLGSFTVTPPEVKSGDLPGVAIKLIYSPALELAMSDAREWDLFIDDMVAIFKEGYSKEVGHVSGFNSINVKGQITPYIHQNVAELMNILCQGVLAGTISVESAAANVPYGEKDEFMRILNQNRREIIGSENMAADIKSGVEKELSLKKGDELNESNMAQKIVAENKNK